MKKRSLDSIVRRLLKIYYFRYCRHVQGKDFRTAYFWLGKHSGMEILFKRVNLEGK